MSPSQCFLILCCGLSFINLAQTKIISTSIIFRHGQRTPIYAAPNYGNSTLTVELGLGQLTLNGSHQLYKLGVKLRNDYLHLFPASGHYRQSNMRIMSSVPGRCIVSLTSFMAGFFPPLKDSVIPFLWQGVPFEVDNDGRVLYYVEGKCPRYDHELNATEVGPEQWLQEDRPYLDQLAEFMGTPLNCFEEVTIVAEVIRASLDLDPSPPSWLPKVYEKVLKKYLIFLFNRMVNTPSMRRMRGGVLLTQIVENMEAFVAKNDFRNFLIYSGHDTNLFTLASIFEFKDQIPDIPHYADAMIFELHDTNATPLEVKIKYSSFTKAGDQREIYLEIPGCQSPCNFNTFKVVVEKYLVKDYVAMCKLN